MSLPHTNSETMPLLKTESRPSFAVKLFAFPTKTELQGCWELCRLHNNIGFWVVWIPTGETARIDELGLLTDIHLPAEAWSIAMVYRTQPELSAADALFRAAIYIPLCFGVKCLVGYACIR